MNKTFQDVKNKLQFVLESRWEAQKNILGDFPSTHSGDNYDVVFRYVGDHLIVLFEISDEVEQTTYVVTKEDLEFWNLTVEELWAHAQATTKIPRFIENRANGSYIYQAEENDGGAACAIFADRAWKGASPAIYLPTSPRQLTVFSPEAMKRGEQLLELVSKEPLMFPPYLLRCDDGVVSPVVDYPVDTKFGAWLAREQFRYQRQIYSEQRAIFASQFKDFSVAPYEIHQNTHGDLFSSITIYEGSETLWLPIVHQVKLRRADQRHDIATKEIDFTQDGAPDDDLITLSWYDFQSFFQNRLEFFDYYPQRFKFTGFAKADLEPLMGRMIGHYQCDCRGVTAEVDGFGFPCLEENRPVQIPELKIRYVPTRVGYRDIFDDEGTPLIMSNLIPSGNVGHHICVYVEYLDAQTGTYKIVDNNLIEQWKTSFDALTRAANDNSPGAKYTHAYTNGDDIVWVTEGGSKANITSLLKLPEFIVNGDLVMWPINEKDIYAFGTETDFMNTDIPRTITANSSFPPFPLLWNEDEEEYTHWLPSHSESMYNWIIKLQNQYIKFAYDEQYGLNKLKPAAKARCELHTAKDGSTFISTSVAADGGYFHFPQVDQVTIWDSFNKETSNKRIAKFRWEDFIELFGENISAIDGSYPVLGLFEGSMPKELLQKSAESPYRDKIIECVCCSA